MRAEVRTDDRWISICDGPVDTRTVEAFVRDERAGAIVVFTGTTRRYTADRETISLAYEAYETMALSTVVRLVDEAAARWPICRVGVCHAVGNVELLEASVCVAVSTPHRVDAFDAARYLIDSLKGEAAIWKKERYSDGSESWVDPIGGGKGDTPGAH